MNKDTVQLLFEHLRIGNQNSYWSIKTIFLCTQIIWQATGVLLFYST